MNPNRDAASGIDLQLFTTDPVVAVDAVQAGITAFVVDWEWRGKESRQDGFDTEINRDSAEDLARVSKVTGSRRICRINRFGPWTPGEVNLAIEFGATQLLLPMAEKPAEVEAYLKLVRGRVRAGILVETKEACTYASELAALGLDAVYVGLNDLAISRGTPCIFTALADGTVEQLREAFGDTPFGFGGLTVVDLGNPIPSMRLLEDMARLRSSFTFLRRSFRRDIVGRDVTAEVGRIQETWRLLLRRGQEQEARDHALLVDAVTRTAGAGSTA
ncbi:MAG: hypothetical protein LAO05_11045 [Acidobacteriia bacterium]|nr:hypothetical protein [Terriglobia bacterium]